MSVPWSTFCTYPDGRPKFDDAWLLNPANVVTSFPSEPSQYCRLCDSYFAGVAAEHIADHAPSLAAWRRSQKAARPVAKKQLVEVTAESNNVRDPSNHAGKNGQDAQETAAHDDQYVFTDFDRKTSHMPKARKRRRETFKGKTDARRAEVWALHAARLVPMAIADRLGISDRSVRRYLSSPTS